MLLQRLWAPEEIMFRVIFKQILVGTALLSALLIPYFVFAANPAFDQAVAAYKARNYHAAVLGFQNAMKSNPSDPMTHYYLALCYQGSNQIALAKQEYTWVSSCSNAQLRSYAASGLANLSKYPSSVNGSGRTDPRSTVAMAGGAPRISGRLKVLEFYTDW